MKQCTKFQIFSASSMKVISVYLLACKLTVSSKLKGHNLSKMEVRFMILGIYTQDMKVIKKANLKAIAIVLCKI